MVQTVVATGVAFGRNMVGIVTRPYETYRRIVYRGTRWEMLFIGVIVAMYLGIAVIVKTPLFRPFFLTRQFLLLGTATAATFLFAVSLFWHIGRSLGARGNIDGFALGWAYSLIPTSLWFWMTSFLYIVLPPPRTTRWLGVLFSIVYLLVSATLLLWKITLSYLALRFGLRLDLVKIIILSSIVLPILALYSVGMYRLGIFRIPFI